MAHDPLVAAAPLERLASMTHRTLRGHFRLEQAYRSLRARVSSAAIERERRRLGRELHTGVGQALAGIHIHLGIVEDGLPDPPEQARQGMDRIRLLAQSAMEQVRGISRRVYAPAWQSLPLRDALRGLWETSGVPEKFGGELALEELSAEPQAEVRAALYRAAQEGLSNAIQHSRARRVRLSLRQAHARLVLEVEDDGHGFPAPTAALEPAGGIGLRSLRDEAHRLGGEFQARSGPEGTKLTLSFPVIQ